MEKRTAAEQFILPALRAYDAAQRRARFCTPGGHLLEHDLAGIRRRAARDHGVTPEDLQRWYDRLSAEQRAALSEGSDAGA